MHLLFANFPLHQVLHKSILMRGLVDLVLDYSQVFTDEVFFIIAKQAFHLSVTVGDYASLACRSYAENNRGVFSVLALAINATSAKSRILEVFFGFSSKLLSTFVIVADRETVSRVQSNVLHSLVPMLAQRFVLKLKFSVYRLNLEAALVEFFLFRPLASKIVPKLMLLQSSFQDKIQELLQVFFIG